VVAIAAIGVINGGVVRISAVVVAGIFAVELGGTSASDADPWFDMVSSQ
jgi:hypothetical protein